MTGNTIPYTGLLLVPNSVEESILAFDPHNGDLVNEFFFPQDSENLSTPMKIFWNHDKTSFLISDQVKHVVQQYDHLGNHINIFAPNGEQNLDILQNIRGVYMKENGNLLVTVSGGQNANAVAEFDNQGAFIGNFINNNEGGLVSPFDIIYMSDYDEYLVTSFQSIGIHRFDVNGNALGIFAPDQEFAQQMYRTHQNSILVSNFSANDGVYEYDLTGNLIDIYSVKNRVRGVYELGNGNILITTNSGVFEINRSDELVDTKYEGSGARFISFIEPPDIDYHTLNLTANPEGAGSVTGGGSFPEGYIATPNAVSNSIYYSFESWTDLMGNEISTEAEFDYNMPDHDITLVANFLTEGTFTVSFLVAENSPHQDAIEGAVIQITEVEPLISDHNGLAEIDLPPGSYNAIIQKDGYHEEQINFDIGHSSLGFDVFMTHVILPPTNVRIETEGLLEGQAKMAWYDPTETVEFRYDDGVAFSQGGFSNGNLNSVLGSVHFHEAEIRQISWYLTDVGGNTDEVKVWIMGLTPEGLPDRHNIIYSAENIPNTNHKWNTYDLESPVYMEDGFFIGVSANGYIGLATDDGTGSPYEFIPGTQFGSNNITNTDFTDLLEWGFELNFLIRAHGVDYGTIEKTKPVLHKAQGKENFSLSLLKQPIVSGKPDKITHAGKHINSYNVFLNDLSSPVASNITENEFLFSNLEGGQHVAAVQSVYSTGVSPVRDIPFEIIFRYDAEFVVRDEQGDIIHDAVITLADTAYEAGHYNFYNLKPGQYNYIIQKEGYNDNFGAFMLQDEDIVVDVVLEKAQTYEVTFKLHMHGADFMPGSDLIYLTGDMFSWADPGSMHVMQLMTPTSDPMIFQNIQNLYAGTYEYKYFLNAGWAGAEWQEPANRTIFIDSDIVVENYFGEIDDISLGYANIPDTWITIKPNPASDILNIKSDAQINEIRLYDAAGRIVLYGNAGGATYYTINTDDYKEGMYLIHLHFEEGHYIERIMISR